MKKLPSIIVTGASGIVGSNFVESIKENFKIYAIARRSQKESGVKAHSNIIWIQVDIGNWINLRWVMHNIKREGGADFIFHLAGYYDFEYTPNPEYERSNIKGTKYMLEQARILRVKRFIFASSSAASEFPLKGEVLTEKSPLDAPYDYARSKNEGEKMVSEFSKFFPCSIVRFAAVFTDCCEYGPLYVFLSTWLEKKWNSRILGGKGDSAVPYIHTNDLNRLIITILNKHRKLPDLDTYLASPDGSTSHRELYDVATKFFYGDKVRPVMMPKFLAYPGVIMRDLIGRITGNRPFERPWMIKYLDMKLDIDSSYTRKALGWAPTKRLSIQRRLLYLIERMKSDPTEWHSRNTIALKRDSLRPNLLIYNSFNRMKDELVNEVMRMLSSPEAENILDSYRKKDKKNMERDIEFFIQLLAVSVRTSERMVLLEYARKLAYLRSSEGFSVNEVSIAVTEMGKIILKRISEDSELKVRKQDIYDLISITLQMTVDEIADSFEKISLKQNIESVYNRDEIENRIEELESFYNTAD
ncbi:MAG: NAD-dependent epimerase/dehydratase family protein [Acidobacteriota bacterium]